MERRSFEEAFKRMMYQCLQVKKGEAVADRIVKFVGNYTKFVNEKGQFLLVAYFEIVLRQLQRWRRRLPEPTRMMKMTTTKPSHLVSQHIC